MTAIEDTTENKLGLRGTYWVQVVDDKGELVCTLEAPNTVVTTGKDYALDHILDTNNTIVGPFLGLISSVSFSAISAGDTQASHSGWLEAGNAHAPTYSGSRPTPAFNAASAGSKSTSSAAVFNMTGSGTVKGCFLVLATGAVATIDSTAGTLYSAGLFTGGDAVVGNGYTLNISYTAAG